MTVATSLTTTPSEDLGPGLRFGLDDEAGIRRRNGRRPSYVDEATGRAVRDAAVLDRIRSLVIPPAWTDVWIAADPRSHVQATGRDARGRKQYRYHPRYREHQDEAKFQLLEPFGAALPTLRKRVDADLRRPGLPRERVVAVVVALLERTLTRVGNEEYARANGSFGLTTLRNQHVRVESRTLRLRFTGKSAKLHDVQLSDGRLAAIVRKCQDLPGQVLFQYVDGDSALHPVRSSDVNDYVRATIDVDATAKTFRTWHATVLAAGTLGRSEPPTSAREARVVVAGMFRDVSSRLNNTPAVCRKSYVHPGVVDAYVNRTLAHRWSARAPAAPRRLEEDERRVLAFLRASY